MTPVLSPNTKAILLLTAPLIAGRGAASPDLLSPGEYKRLARHLRERQREPADLISPDAADLLRACQAVIEQSRLQRLLGRGFLLSQAIERWQARAIWVVSRADAEYPRRLKPRLREDAPAVLYGCGDISLLETGGLAVVGSRDVEDTLIEYTMAVGGLAARAGRTLVSGGAKGIDQAAMRGALEAGGTVIGVLADSLEKTAMNRDHRNLVIDGRLVLTSPYDPSAGFNVGNAMQRNKIIYALADASLVVSSNINKGGTWAGAIEQLDKLRLVPIYVRSTGEASEGLEALRRKGAIDWPNPQDADAFEAIFDIATSTKTAQVALSLGSNGVSPVAPSVPADTEPTPHVAKEPSKPFSSRRKEQYPAEPMHPSPTPSRPPGETSNDGDSLSQAEKSPADALFAAARDEIQRLLKAPMKEAEVAVALEVSTAQAKAWLQRLVKEGVLEKQKKPAGYIVKQSHLFE